MNIVIMRAIGFCVACRDSSESGKLEVVSAKFRSFSDMHKKYCRVDFLILKTRRKRCRHRRRGLLMDWTAQGTEPTEVIGGGKNGDGRKTRDIMCHGSLLAPTRTKFKIFVMFSKLIFTGLKVLSEYRNQPLS